jgi:hypothetical protein
MTLDEMIQLEPGLQELREDVAVVEDDKTSSSFCANRLWIRRFKPRLIELVGSLAGVEELRTSEAYDVAYRELYQILPPCRNCLCL